jgi:hypothetical protein
MSLEDQIKTISNDFEQATPETIIDVLNQIEPHFKSTLISEYLQGKIKKIQDSDNIQEKKKQCKVLLPYFDWYLQGL